MKKWVVTALLGLVLSGVLISYFRLKVEKKALSEKFSITQMTQTGPQKEALKTEVLAEILGLSIDRPVAASRFNLKKAKKRLLSCPLIRRAELEVCKGMIYVDYAVRKPSVWIRDAENLVMDRDGYLFPFTPFFTPKKMTEFYLGLSREECVFNQQVGAKGVSLAFDILDYFLDTSLFVACIDVSKVQNQFLGSREVVVILEQERQRHTLRLSPQDYENGVQRYFSLRNALDLSRDVVIDLRVPKLAYVQAATSES